MADRRGFAVEWIAADVPAWTPPQRAFDLVAIFYLQLPQRQLGPVLRGAADAVAPGGVLLSTRSSARYAPPRAPDAESDGRQSSGQQAQGVRVSPTFAYAAAPMRA